MPCCCFGAFGIGAHQAEDPVGVLPECVPGFLAVDDVVVACGVGAPLGSRLQRGKIRAGTRFGVTLTPPVLATDDAWQELLLLLATAEGHDDGCNHLQAERNRAWRAGRCGLFVEDVQLHWPPARAAKLLWPTGRSPAALEQDLLPSRVVGSSKSQALLDAVADVGRQLVLEEGPHLVTKRQFVGGEIQIHRQSPVSNSGSAMQNMSFPGRPAS